MTVLCFYLIQPVDFENPAQKRFTFDVVVHDTNVPTPNSAEAAVVIIVEDYNDNEPVFPQSSQPLTISLPENKGQTTIIDLTLPQDMDSGDNGNFE